MTSKRATLRREARIGVPFAVAFLLPALGCGEKPAAPRAVDVAAFKELASRSDCADARNRLYVVDGRLVFWDREGSCTDAAFSLMLFGPSPDRELCRIQDSIAGTVESYRDASYKTEFGTMVANHDRPDLGLGPHHTVERIF